MIRFCLAFIFCGAGSALWAQDVVIRTGDHPQFTRLVLSMPQGTSWELTRTDSGYGLRVEEPAILDTDRFFERIRRDRVSAIRQGSTASELLIDLACDCYAEAFQWRSDQVVIDFKDPGSDPSADTIEIKDARQSSGTINADLPQPPVPSPTPRPPGPEIELPLIMSAQTIAPIPQPSVDPLAQLLVEQTRVGSLENAIASSLERALGQGLLDPGQDQLTMLGKPSEEEDLATLLNDVEAALTPGVIARTSVDGDAQVPSGQVSDGSEVTCVLDTFVDVPSWTSDIPFATHIGNLRTQITGEFDRTDPAAVEALAKAYITFGFGREAISTLSIDGLKSHERAILQTLGEIVDNDQLTIDDFHLQIGCQGHVALWGLLAHEDGPLPAQPDITSVIVSFKLLPKPLREHLAPRLASKLNALGFQDFAADVLSVGDKDKIEVATAELEILIDQGATEEVAQRLTNMADDSARMTPEALMKLINIELAAGSSIDANELTLYEAAQTLIDDQQDILTSDLAAQFRSDILKQLIIDEDDADFLILAFDPLQDVSDTANQNAIAARLISLGFPERAEEFIAGQARGEEMMERRYLRAEAAMAMQNTEAASAHLAGITTSRAQEILASLSNTARNETKPRPIEAALEETQEDPLLVDLAERIQDITTFQPETQTPLTDGRELVDESETLRANMASLLERYQIDP